MKKSFFIMAIVAITMFANVNLKAFQDLDNDMWWDISTYNELISLSQNSQYWTGQYELTANIQMPSGWNFSPIGTPANPFTGKFRGNNPSNYDQFKIFGLTINRPYDSNIGLFGFNIGEISNVVMCHFTISGNECVGALCGRNLGSISNCEIYFDVANDNFAATTVTGNTSVGGMVGASAGIALTNCKPTLTRYPEYTYAVVTGEFRVGGFVGSTDLLEAYHIINNEVYNTNVIGADSEIGGFVGYNYGIIEECYVSDSCNVLAENADYVGGFVGKNSLNIFLSSAKSDVFGYNYVGGFMGIDSGNVHDCYATGDTIHGNDMVGGFAGIIGTTGWVVRCFAANKDLVCTPGLMKGGFVADNLNGWITQCRWDAQSIDYYWTSDGGMGLYTSTAKDYIGYQYWDFTNIWELTTENDGYPSFRVEPYYKMNFAGNISNVQVYPNPVINVSTININNCESAYTTVSVYNINGDKIETLYSGNLNTSEESLTFDGNKYTTGVYYLVLETPNNRTMEPILVRH